MSFSPCGKYLRVASIGVADVGLKSGLRTGNVRLPTKCCNLNVVIYELSGTKPTKRPPKVAAAQTIRFPHGRWLRPLVQQLPFASTWCPEDLYLTINES